MKPVPWSISTQATYSGSTRIITASGSTENCLKATVGIKAASAEERRAIKLAEAFRDFAHCPHHLAPIPISVLFKLTSEKYRSIINQLQDYPIGGLTCELVLELIAERKAIFKAQQQDREEEEISIWRRTPKGERYVQFPPVWEDNHQTGVLAEELIKEYGLLPQHILREAIADYYDKIKAAI